MKRRTLYIRIGPLHFTVEIPPEPLYCEVCGPCWISLYWETPDERTELCLKHYARRVLGDRRST